MVPRECLFFMESRHHIIIAGSGGIARAAALLLVQWSTVKPVLYIGNRTLGKAERLVQWIKDSSPTPVEIEAFPLRLDQQHEVEKIFEKAQLILDCLPGSLAPRVAELAVKYRLHYVNLTEHVAETEMIKKMAQDAQTGFVLQSGLAPGYIGILAHGLFMQFCQTYLVDKVDRLEMKVGALSDHAVAPHFYGFTWSPVGVATEYLKDTLILRNYKLTRIPSLSELSEIVIEGTRYEENLTSGGAADLPETLEGRVRHLDYKTLRHPGHYRWIQSLIDAMVDVQHPVEHLQNQMEVVIPHLENDRIILYAAVQGKDRQGTLRRQEIAKKILPLKVGPFLLRAIQTTTAAPMLQAAAYLLEKNPRGIILQSQLDPFSFLEGQFITPVYGPSGLNTPKST